MTSEGLLEMFEGYSADMCADKFLLTSMGGQAEGLACADPGVRTPIGVSGNSKPSLASPRYHINPIDRLEAFRVL